MKFTVLAACVFTASAGGVISRDSTMSCTNEDFGMRALLQSKVGNEDCEKMCKRIGAYPNCQCPGFNGQAASSDDTRACYTQYCQDPKAPCPNDAFVNCVSANSKVSALLQWDSVFANVDSRLNMIQQAMRKNKESMSCAKNDHGALALLEMKAANMGIECEEMCKRIGAYPNCACPGFNGQAASSDDTRGCYTKYCQDPRKPCPNGPFNTCVDQTTKVSALQWKAVMSHTSKQLDALLQVVKQRNTTEAELNANAAKAA